MPSFLPVLKIFPLYFKEDLTRDLKCSVSLNHIGGYLLGFISSLVPLPEMSLAAFPEYALSKVPLQKNSMLFCTFQVP